MLCEQVENRLNQLLDRRRSWIRDRELAAHCAHCERCRSMAEAYSAFDALGGQLPSPPPDFAARVLAELEPKQPADSARRSRINSLNPRRMSWHWLAVAALVLIAVTIGLRRGGSPDLAVPRQVDASIATTIWPLQEEFDRLLGEERKLSEVVWQSTGREFAKLPHQVRRAADLSESSQLIGAIRPMAAAWQSFRRVLPGESMRSEPATGETSYYLVAAEIQAA